jgi:hypothetical protein
VEGLPLKRATRSDLVNVAVNVNLR